MIRRTATRVGVAVAMLGGLVAAATPAAAHNGVCYTTSRTITQAGRVVTGRESIACNYQHRIWSICGALDYQSAATGGWVQANHRCDYIDSGAGSTKTTHTYTLSATCDPLAGVVQEWWFHTFWQVGDGLQPHYGGDNLYQNIICL